MKLVNKSGKEQDVVLNMFKFDVPPPILELTLRP